MQVSVNSCFRNLSLTHLQCFTLQCCYSFAMIFRSLHSHLFPPLSSTSFPCRGVSWGRGLRGWAQVEPQLGRRRGGEERRGKEAEGGEERKEERARRGGDEDAAPHATQEGVHQKKKRKQTHAFTQVKKKKDNSFVPQPSFYTSPIFSLPVFLSHSFSPGRGLAGLGLNAICCIM